MQTREVTLVKVNHFCVNCEMNDPVDIQCGGPEYLGYDFYIDCDINEEDIFTLIKEELKKNNQPLHGIQVHEDEIDIKYLFSPAKVRECIKKGYK